MSASDLRSQLGVSLSRLSPGDIQLFNESIASVFDRSSLGVLRVNPDLTIAFANNTALKICGLNSLEGTSLQDVLADENAWNVIRHEFAQRRQGFSGEYEVDVLHREDGRRIPVRVVAMPIFTSDGGLSGALSILRSVEIERAVEAFDRDVRDADGTTAILHGICVHVGRAAPSDIVSISVYSSDEREVRTVYRYDPNGHIFTDQRWYPVPEAQLEFMRNPEVQALSFSDLIAKFKDYQSHPAIQQLMKQGYLRVLRYPILRGHHLIASVSCLSRDPAAFSDAHVEIVRALPVPKALLMALHYLDTEELQFRFDLVKDMFGRSGPKALATVLCERLAQHYGWKSVEVYWVDEVTKKFKLLSQWCDGEEFKLEGPFEQAFGTGVLGYTYLTGEDVNIEDVSSEPAFQGVYRNIRANTRSELCMPIRVDGKIMALLNIEDNVRSAFSHHEQLTLRSLLDEVGNLLAAAQTQSLIVQTFLATPSAVFVTDGCGTIIRTNPAAATLLGYTALELAKTNVNQYLAGIDNVQALFKAGCAEIEAALKTKSGRTVPVLAGAHELEGFGAWVISAKDISYRKRLEQLETLGQMYRELAAQMKTPLTVASGWLRRLRKQKESEDPETAEILSRTLGQVKKLDITFERLALYDQRSGFAPYNPILLDLAQLLNRLMNEIPRCDCDNLVKTGVPDSGVYVHADAYQISFIVQTILAYLFRFLPEDENVYVDLATRADDIQLVICGWFPSAATAQPEEVAPEALQETLNDMALGEQVIKRFIANHGGSYSKTLLDDGVLRFEIGIPKAHVEV